MLGAARWGAYATCALIAVAVFVLAYAFQTHDFRIRYVMRYSDRSMPWWYLVTALWGGQDGSLLWWSFLLGGWTVVCVRWMRGRYMELQPWIIATLMSIIMFFGILMLFAANPFAVQHGGVPVDGEGLNPLLQNYWMTIHPPTLYMGFVGWSVPFAIVIAALITGRLHDEWIHAARRWVLWAWLFLSVGNLLGALWSYEELGWGGYWAWDPVENAAFMPWLVGTAYLHSVMVQERYGMLKVWNVFLLCATFWMTIFGTFLTRSGLIASVHSFAKSDIGIYFAWYLAIMAVAILGLISYRLPELRKGLRFDSVSLFMSTLVGFVVGFFVMAWAMFVQAVHPKRRLFREGKARRIESFMSREFSFLLNNWILLAMMVVILIFSTFPLLSEWIRGEEVTVGPPFYNKWMVPFGLVLLFLMGVGPLISWRKATGKNLARAFSKPLLAGAVAAIIHILFGASAGFPAFVESEEIYDTMTGKVLAGIFGVFPVVSSAFCAFVLGTVTQEFWRGTAVRMRTKGENAFVAFVRLIARARRRYGGYTVHVGIVLMYIGFTGAAYDHEKEAALTPGQSMEIQGYQITFEEPRMESDPNKRALYADMTIRDEDGDLVDKVSPAKFIYRTHPEMPTTEVAIETGLVHDLYVIMSTVDPNTKRGTFKVIVRPLVLWIWIGSLVLILGTMIAVFPSIREMLSSDRRGTGVGGRAAGLAALLLALALPFAPTSAQAQDSSSLHAGSVSINDKDERKLFERTLCMCGDCARLTLASCGCSWAENMRWDLRDKMAEGKTVTEITDWYREEYGPSALSIPSDEGLDRALWAIPIAAVLLAIGGVFVVGRRWKKSAADGGGDGGGKPPPDRGPDDPYDAQLDEELERMEGE